MIVMPVYYGLFAFNMVHLTFNQNAELFTSTSIYLFTRMSVVYQTAFKYLVLIQYAHLPSEVIKFHKTRHIIK